MNANRRTHAFTLIELMTVATIISMLAAIAIPNFLNAIVRAKVARSMAEQELICWAIEMYEIDSDGYPDNTEIGRASIGDLTPLTTPIPYLSQLPFDIFVAPAQWERKDFIRTQRGGNPFYFYINFIQSNDGQRKSLAEFGTNGSANYTVWGLGPKFSHYADPMKPSSFISYNPSNGTTSVGVINTFGP